MAPRLSVITATMNSEETIAASIESRQRMLGGIVRHIIQDGGSTDATLEIISQSDDGAINLVSSPDNGIYDALNKAVHRVDTEWLMFLHSDDQLVCKDVIRDIAVAENEGLPAISYGVRFCTASGRVFRHWPVRRYSRGSFRYGFMLPHTGLVVRRHLFRQFGDFRLDLGSVADYEWILRVFFKGGEKPLLRPGKYLVQMRAGGLSDAGLKRRLQANHSDRRAWEVNGLRPSRLFRLLKPLRKAFQFI